MTNEPCAQPIALEALIAYWFGELSPPAEALIEEHFLGCPYCAWRLEQLIAGADIERAANLSGDL